MAFIFAKVSSNSAIMFIFPVTWLYLLCLLFFLLLWPFNWSLLPIHLFYFLLMIFWSFPTFYVLVWIQISFVTFCFRILYICFINSVKNFNNNTIALVLIFTWTYVIFQPPYYIKHVTYTISLILKYYVLLYSSDE